MSTSTRITVEEFDRMIEAGEFYPEARIELIHGELIEVPPPNPPHEYVVDLLNRWSFRAADLDEVLVRVQQSVGLPELDSVPVPDISWVRNLNYRRRRPQPDDVFLVIEVSDSSLRNDKGAKAELYAQAGVTDYWVVNIPDNCIHVYRNPADGGYPEPRTFTFYESVSPLAFPDIVLKVQDLFRDEAAE